MAIDAYSLCPGGTGKKIKFCCPDRLGDLKTLMRMIEGEQYAAALQHLESLASGDRPRECLLALKIELLRTMDRDEEARATTRAFLERFPDNPIALAASAADVADFDEDGPAAMGLLQKALAAGDERLSSQVYDALSAVGDRMAESGRFRSALALWRLQAIVNPNDRRPQELLAEILRSDDVSLLLRDEPPIATCPAGFPLAEEFGKTLAPLGKAQWAEAARRLENLTNKADGEPALWRNLALVRGWLGDDAGMRAALEKLASLDVPLEDAVEATATALLLGEDPLGDAIDGVRLTFPVQDADELAGMISTWKNAVIIPADPSVVGEEEVPPKMIFVLLDRPVPETPQSVNLDTVSRMLGHAMLYGRQTDREARLVVSGAMSTDEEQIARLLGEVAGGRITGPPQREAVVRLSATRALLARPWHLPPDISREAVIALAAAHMERAAFEAWPKLKLGVFGGRSLEEVAGEPAMRNRALAALMILDDSVRQMGEPVDMNRLRSRLGLPTLGPIDPKETPTERLPLVRLHRVMVEKLPDDAVVAGFRRAVVFRARDAMLALGRELVDRPGVETKEKQMALAGMAANERDWQRALDLIERGRVLTESQGQSSAPWDLQELELRVAMRDMEGIQRLFEHLQRDHLREPGVADAVRSFLYRLGVIDAEGRPIAHEPVGEVLPEEVESQPTSQLWTPDSEKPAGEKSKLWIPD